MSNNTNNNQEQKSLENAVLDRRHFLKMAAALGGSALTLSSLNSIAHAEHRNSKSINTKTGKAQAQTEKNLALAKQKILTDYNPAALIEARTFPGLATVEGISQNQLNQHLGLYQGYVKKINELDAKIKGEVPDLDAMNPSYSPFREQHVEQTFALNGVVLHELYFENIGGPKAPASAWLQSMFAKEFGSWDNYLRHLTAVGKSARGWAITGYNMRDHRIHNYLLDLHNQWVPYYVMPLLVLDVYEHAYMIDFGTKRPAYLDAFLKNVNWAVVEDRLATMAMHYTPHT